MEYCEEDERNNINEQGRMVGMCKLNVPGPTLKNEVID